MPKIHDPHIKIKQIKKSAEKLRPWLDIEKFKPTSMPEMGNIKDNEKGNETDNKIDNERGNKEVTERVTKRVTIGNERGNIRGNKTDLRKDNERGNNLDEYTIIKSLRKTEGYQRMILQFILYNLRKSSFQETLIELSIASLTSALKVSKGIIKTSIIRLEQKGILIREKGQIGRHGLMRFKFSNFVIDECLNIFSPKPLIGNEMGNKTGNERDNPIYSSSNNIKTTTTELPSEWQNIDTEPLRSIGFGKSHIQQLIDKNTPEQVEESIHQFAWGLANKGSACDYPNKLKAFIGVLRKGGVWVEEGYVSEEDRRIQAMLEAKKRKDQERKMRIDQLFDDWKKVLTEDQIREIVPANVTLQGAIAFELKKYFIENILTGY